jgi:glycosyltransferase involved in cell wall biosynthesis
MKIMLINKKYDIGIIGDLCGNDILLAETMLKNNIKPIVLRPASSKNASQKEEMSLLGSYILQFSSNDIYYFKSAFDLFRTTCRCKVLISFTLGIISHLRRLYPLIYLPCFPPVINVTTGSDITELIAENTFGSRLYRHHLRMSQINLCACYPHAIKNIQKYRIPNVYFSRFPYYVAPKKFPFQEDEHLVFFHPSHFDWKVNDPGAYRNSSKGNDRFVRAFMRAVRNGLRAKCVILYRGSDRDEAKKMIAAAGMEDHFIWREHLTRDELFDEYSRAHVVVDQFDVGGLGGISVEAMSVGRPVIMYVNENCARLIYSNDLPPVLNCWSEDEIYEQIMKCKDRLYFHDMGNKSREWVMRNHHWSTCMDQFLFYYSLLTGHIVKDYGWNKSAYGN